MTPLLISSPASEPLSLAEAKSWIKVDGADDDAVIQSLITSARLAVEAATNRLLISQQWRLVIDAWPDSGYLRLPLTPVRAVSRIRTLDASGASTDVPTSLYSVDLNLDHARLLWGAGLPAPGLAASGIWIDLLAGYGDATAVPEPFRLAMRMLVAQWYGDRGDGASSGMPASLAAVLAPYRVRRLA